MDRRRVRPGGFGSAAAALAVLAAGLGAPAPASAAQRPAPSPTGYAQVRRVCESPAPGAASCLALLRVPVRSAGAATAGARPYALNDGATSSGPAGGLTPAQLASAYEFDPNAGGTGQTVAVVDAYDDPKVEEDLGEFDSHYNLAPCTQANGCFEKVGQTGSGTSLPAADTAGWSVETSLDVEAVHAACPKCKVLLVEADGPTYQDLAIAVNEAVSLGATEVSNSYGGPEAGIGASERAAYDHPGVVITAATGDDGYDGWDLIDELIFFEGQFYFGPSPEMPNAPASLPSVVSVGGTSLHLSAGGSRESEDVWNNNGPGDEIGINSGFAQGASGGGCSTLFTAQRWQQSVAGFAATGCGTRRLSADISAVANPLTGFDIYDSYNCGSYCEEVALGKGWVTIGGTSLSTPLISSLYALAGGGDGVKYPALTLYGHRADATSLYDVTEGANGFCGGEPVLQCGNPNGFFGRVDCEGTTACNAAPGFDGPSGVGAPEGIGAFEPLRPSATITPPPSPEAGVAASFGAGSSSDPYPGGSIAGYSWSWGDGTPDSAGPSPAHTFAVAGEYTVSLSVTDNYGLTSLSTKTVNVGEPATAGGHEEGRVAVGPAQGTAAFQAQTSPTLPDARLAVTTLDVSTSGSVSVKVSCPVGESECVGTLSLRTLAAVSASVAGTARHKAVLTLASGSFTVPGGSVKTVTLHLSAEARKLLARSHVLRARASLLAHDPAGSTHATREIVQLRLARKRHG